MSLSSSPQNDKTRAISDDKNGAASSDEPGLFLADHLGIASRTNPWAVGGATLVNGVFLALLLCMGFRTTIDPGPTDPAGKTDVDLSRFLPIVAEKSASAPSGGSGNHELIDPIEGRLPRFVPCSTIRNWRSTPQLLCRST